MNDRLIAAHWGLLVYGGLVAVLAASMVLISHVLGERHRDRVTAEPYESGMMTTGSARVRLAANFYLLAMFFVIFDLEILFVVAWAVAARELGWPGYVELLVFLGVLGAALAYLWRLGALDWQTSSRRGGTGAKGARASHEP